METFLFLIVNFLVDIRNLRLVCHAWNHTLEEYDYEIATDILNRDRSLTLHEHMIKAVKENDVNTILQVYRMSYKPIIWDHLAFVINTRQIYNLLKYRMSRRYRNLALIMITPDDKVTSQRVHSDFAVFQTDRRLRSLTFAVLNNDVELIHTLQAEYHNLQGPMRDIIYSCFLRAHASKEACNILGVPHLYGRIKERSPLPHEYPFPLPNMEISTLIKYGRIDHLDLLIADDKIGVADISTMMEDNGLRLYPSLITYIEMVIPYY